MTNKEKLELLDNMLICYVDRTNLTNKQIEESEEFIEELRETILVTRCSLQFNSLFKKGDKVIYCSCIDADVLEVINNDYIMVIDEFGEKLKVKTKELELATKRVTIV